MGGGVARAFPADIAMHVVLPEIDGRVFAGIASFKEAGTRDPALGFARTIHRADAGRIEAITARVAGWIALAQTPVAERRVALVLSTYPGKAYQIAHAVGLDALASAEAILADLAEAGYATDAQAGLAALLNAHISTGRWQSTARRWQHCPIPCALNFSPHGASRKPMLPPPMARSVLPRCPSATRW